MEPVVKFEQPSIRLTVQTGRAIDRSFDYRDKVTHEPRHVVRKCLQGSFNDASGFPTICACLPCRDWDCDLSPLSRKSVDLFVSEFTMGNDGINIVRFCGYQINEPKK